MKKSFMTEVSLLDKNMEVVDRFVTKTPIGRGKRKHLKELFGNLCVYLVQFFEDEDFTKMVGVKSNDRLGFNVEVAGDCHEEVGQFLSYALRLLSERGAEWFQEYLNKAHNPEIIFSGNRGEPE